MVKKFEDFKKGDLVTHVEEGQGRAVAVKKYTVRDPLYDDEGAIVRGDDGNPVVTERYIEEVHVQFEKYKGSRGPHAFSREWVEQNPDVWLV